MEKRIACFSWHPAALELYGILLQRLLPIAILSPLDVDRLVSYNPQNHILKYMEKHFNFPQPVGSKNWKYG